MARWSRFAPDADRRLVKGLHDGDDDVVATLYDVYAERLYDYCMALLDNTRVASDVVHDTFIDASRRAPRMRDRARLRPWLYSAARRRCMQRKPQLDPGDGHLLKNLDFLQREALFLAIRHDLTGDDLALTLGVPSRRAEARLQRARESVPDADEYLGAAPAPALPTTLRRRVQHTGTDPELAGYRAEIAARGGALTPEGMPRQPDAPSPLTRRWMFTSAGLFTAMVTAAIAVMFVAQGLPVPNIEWPGGRPHTALSPSHHPRPRAAKGGRPGNEDGLRPTTAPQVITTPSPGSRSPAPTPPSHGIGVLAASPGLIYFQGRERLASIQLSARGGPVSWSAVSSTPQISLARDGGVIRDHGSVIVGVVLNRGLVTLPGKATITVTSGSGQVVPVSVTWATSVL